MSKPKYDKMAALSNLQTGMAPVHSRRLTADIHHSTFVKVKCKEVKDGKRCNKTRLVFKQDAHQVERCVDCQRKRRNSRPKNKGAAPAKPTQRKENGNATKRKKRGPKSKVRLSDFESPTVLAHVERRPSEDDTEKIIL